LFKVRDTTCKNATKATLLETGLSVFLEKGYNNSGIETILQAANVPRGSFYYYFASKEDFGIQVLNRFAGEIQANFERCLSDTSLSPLERIRSYFEQVCERLESQQCRNGCLVGNLSQEMADQSEAFRSRLEAIFGWWRDRYATCLKEAQDAGELPTDLDVLALAEFSLGSWQGAILRAKASRSITPVRTFIQILFGHVLVAREKTDSTLENSFVPNCNSGHR